MSRTGRKYKYASFFHIIVQGINKEEIFKEKRYINEYLNLIKRYTRELNLDIMAYCIMTNHAHLLIKTDKVEKISKLMQKVNSLYARYYNYMKNGRVGYVFRDRFVSEPIDSKTYLINCIKYIHMNPVKAGIVDKCGDYEFSTFNDYLKEVKKTNWNKDENILNKNDYIEICNNIYNHYEFCDIDKISIKDKFDAGTQNYIKKEQIELWQVFNDRYIYVNFIKYLKNIEKIKYIDIRKNLLITKNAMDRIIRIIKDENNIAKGNKKMI